MNAALPPTRHPEADQRRAPAGAHVHHGLHGLPLRRIDHAVIIPHHSRAQPDPTTREETNRCG